ncbi:MAG: VirB4 family type IV secretion/conjugal transfer ATPase [Pseudomonadota bacterium]
MAQRTPYAAHLTAHIVSTKAGDCLQVFRLRGAPFESADDVEINGWHERLNALLRNISAPEIALWAHVIRDRADLVWPVSRVGGFAQRLDERYRQRLRAERLYTSDLYLTVLYRPLGGLAVAPMAGLFSKARRTGQHRGMSEALEACERLRALLMSGLDRYAPELLGLYSRGAWLHSEVLEFLSRLVNAEHQPRSLARGPLDEQLGVSRVLCGSETIEYRTATRSRLGAMLGLKDYPTPTVPGMLNPLLSAPTGLVISQSFVCLTKATAQGLLQRQAHRLRNAGDYAASQAQALSTALDELSSNEYVMGDHHFSVQVLTDLSESGSADVEGATALNERLATVRSLLTDVGITTAREDLALEASYWAQLPGNFALRPRKAPITSRNFAALAPWHGYPGGRAEGNHWGAASTVLLTRARSPYYFSLHSSDGRAASGGSREDTGHAFFCGPTGSGKTVFVGFLLAALSTRNVTQVVFDKDRGLEVLVRALGGSYRRLSNGEPTGFNPLQLHPSPHHLEFLRIWLRQLLQGGEANASVLSPRDEADLDQALRGTLALEVGERRLSRLLEFLDTTDEDGPYARLSPWCASQSGERAWAFDNATDTLAEGVGQTALMGFDVTDFLDHALLRAPITLYLFHLVRSALDGRRFACWLDEFGRLLSDSAFRRFAQEGPNTWRKLNAVMCLSTQSPRDVLSSPISRAIVEQTPTKVFFPNPEASAEDYIEGFNLSEREFELLRHQLLPGSRQFLVKQGGVSVVCELDLQGFAAELAVISGRAATVRKVDELISQCGSGVDQWLPQFLRAFELPASEAS